MSDRSDPAPQPTAVQGESDATAGQAPATADVTSLDRVRAICPYAISGDGAWRTVAPAREQHCAAVDPPAPVAVDKQRRLCLVAAHEACPTFMAARGTLMVDDEVASRPGEATSADAASAEPTAGVGESAEAMAGGEPISEATPAQPPGRWPMPRTTPVVIERGRPSLASWRPGRTATQLGLVGLMVLAFALLAVARLASGDGSPAAGSPGSSAPASVAPSQPHGSAPSAPTATPSLPPSPSP